jgi:hypothetical protein
MRYAVSGANLTGLAVTQATSTEAAVAEATALFQGQYLFGSGNSSGRVLWLKSAWAWNATTAVGIILFDATAGSVVTDSSRKFKFLAASGQTTMVEFPAPGLKFSTGVCAAREVSAGTATSPFSPGKVGGIGYEE